MASDNPIFNLRTLISRWSRVEITRDESGTYTVRGIDDNIYTPLNKPFEYVAQQGRGKNISEAIAACMDEDDDTRLDEAIARAQSEDVRLVTDGEINNPWVEHWRHLPDKLARLKDDTKPTE